MTKNVDLDALRSALQDNHDAHGEMRFFLMDRLNPRSMASEFRKVAPNNPQVRDLRRAASRSQITDYKMHDHQSPTGLAEWLYHGIHDLTDKVQMVIGFRLAMENQESFAKATTAPGTQTLMLKSLGHGAAHYQNTVHNLKLIFAAPAARHVVDYINDVDNDAGNEYMDSTRKVFEVVGADFDQHLAAAHQSLETDQAEGYEFFRKLRPTHWKKGAHYTETAFGPITATATPQHYPRA